MKQSTINSIKYLFCTIVVVYVLLSSCIAQKKIENLTSDDDVINFVKQYYANDDHPDPAWKSFQLIDGEEWKDLYNLNKDLEDSLSALRVTKWKKLYIDSDKKEDLIVSGKCIDNGVEEYVVLIFLSKSSDDPYEDNIRYDGEYDVKSILLDDFTHYPCYFSLLSISDKNIPLIRVTNWSPNVNNISSKSYPFTVDTLELMQNYLLNFNAHPDSLSVRSFRFESLNNDGRKIELTIGDMNNEKSSKYKIVEYNNSKDSIVIRGKIKQRLYKGLLMLVNNCSLGKLPSKFESNMDPKATNIINIEYKDGSLKNIRDESGMGTYSLTAVYGWCGWFVNYCNTYYWQRKSVSLDDFNW